MFNDFQPIIFSFLFLCLFILSVVILKMYITHKRHITESNNILFSLIRKLKYLDDDYILLKEQNETYSKDIKRLLEMVNSLGVLEQKNSNSISSLTSSINNVIQENKKRSEEKIYPTPQLSDMIKTTIDEFIMQEISMIKDMRFPVSPTSPVTVKITTNVIKTYPYVDEEYIAKKVIQRLTEASRE